MAWAGLEPESNPALSGGTIFAVERLEQADKLITKGKYAVGILSENLAKLLIGRVISYIAPLEGGSGSASWKVDFSLEGAAQHRLSRFLAELVQTNLLLVFSHGLGVVITELRL